MYYPNTTSVIEADDILSVLSCQVEALENGTQVAHLVLELDSTHKQYDGTPMFHVTNGVEHRLLTPTSLVVPEPLPATATTSDESAQEPTSVDAATGGNPSTPARRKRDERGE